MKRKTFLKRLTLGTGGAVLLPSASLLQSCDYKPQIRETVTEADVPLLDEIGETIIPATEASPGAKASKIGQYILLMYNDCMPSDVQTVFLNGLNELDARSAKTFSGPFTEADASQKLAFLKTLQIEAMAYNLKMKDIEKPLPHYYGILKSLTISGYFSSEIGMTEARNYLPVPGKFEACIPYHEGDKPWAM